jgi:hypothetical protein
VTTTIDLVTDGVVATTRQEQASRDRLERFLPKDEPLIWIGCPLLSRLLLRAVTRTVVMAIIASVGIYFAYHGISIEDVCGVDPPKACRKLYVFPWLGLVAASVYTPLLWLSLLFHATGLLRESYGLTERQALKLRSNPFDRFQSIKLDTLGDQRIGTRRRFGTLGFGWLTFLCLSDKDADTAMQALGAVRRTEEPGQHAGRGAAP